MMLFNFLLKLSPSYYKCMSTAFPLQKLCPLQILFVKISVTNKTEKYKSAQELH